MKTEHDGPGLVLLGGALVATSALVWSARRTRPTINAQTDTTSSLGTETMWVHPVPSILGLGEGGAPRLAVVSNPFTAQASLDRDAHLGVDLFYPRRSARDLITAFPSGSAGGSPMFVMPLDVPALAASAGVVTFAEMTPVGNTVIVRHANGWATYYTHLATLAVQRGARVRAGQQLGTIGASPKDGARLRHLHFELWPRGKREGAIDPKPYLDAWSRVTITWPIAPPSVLPRNGTLSAYRAVGNSGDPYPEWVRSLRGESGVYVIREIDGPIVYVGSSVGRLYETLTRHLQRWRRWKGYWRGQFGEGADPGLTYRRSSVEVAIKTTTPDEAHEEELRLIRRLQPRDNQLGQPELEDAPF